MDTTTALKNDSKNIPTNIPKIGTIMKKTFKTSRIITTDAYHDCFSRNICNDYVILQVMYIGQRNLATNSESMFIVEFIKEDDYKKELENLKHLKQKNMTK
mgnify:CR=1 FL=1